MLQYYMGKWQRCFYFYIIWVNSLCLPIIITKNTTNGKGVLMIPGALLQAVLWCVCKVKFTITEKNWTDFRYHLSNTSLVYRQYRSDTYHRVKYRIGISSVSRGYSRAPINSVTEISVIIKKSKQGPKHRGNHVGYPRGHEIYPRCTV